MSAAHRMPFGAECGDDGVRFRLWAPALAAVDLRVRREGHWDTLAMTAGVDGWFEVHDAAAGDGTRYCFRLPDGTEVPDPASRWQPLDVHGPSQVVDPRGYAWRCTDWTGRPWTDAVVYELHVGAFTPRGDFDGVVRRLDHLRELGVTALELMPVADFPGRWNWGYDGVLPFAPDATYGHPDELRRLVDEAHARGLMVLLDVVYNHFGPDGNYLHLTAPAFFTDRVSTPWGDAIDFTVPQVREYFINNALYWLEEFRFDGLRLDAVHAIVDDSDRHVLAELAERVHGRFDTVRQVHLVLENDDNAARFLARGSDGRARQYRAQWNDDLHHALHVLATGERDGYYADYADAPADHLLRCLTEGFAWQGEPSPYRDGTARGEPSAHLPPEAFVGFVQNHDQVGNRAFGERLATLADAEACAAVSAVLLLAPSVPLLFMGEEWGATQPFLYFCDFPETLARQVREGRAREFAAFERFADGGAEALPDPTLEAAFEDSVLEWGRRVYAPHAAALALHRGLLRLRHEHLLPRLRVGPAQAIAGGRFGDGGVHAKWRLADGSVLALQANLHGETAKAAAAPAPGGPSAEASRPSGDAQSASGAHGGHVAPDASPSATARDGLLFTTHGDVASGRLAPWQVTWRLLAAQRSESDA